VDADAEAHHVSPKFCVICSSAFTMTVLPSASMKKARETMLANHRVRRTRRHEPVKEILSTQRAVICIIESA
jgi:hypothetical protein